MQEKRMIFRIETPQFWNIVLFKKCGVFAKRSKIFSKKKRLEKKLSKILEKEIT